MTTVNNILFAPIAAPDWYAVPADRVSMKNLDAVDTERLRQWMSTCRPGDTWTSLRCFSVGSAAGEPVRSIRAVAAADVESDDPVRDAPAQTSTAYAVVPALGCYTSGQWVEPHARYSSRREAERHARRSRRLDVLAIAEGDDPGPWRGWWLDRLHTGR